MDIPVESNPVETNLANNEVNTGIKPEKLISVADLNFNGIHEWMKSNEAQEVWVMRSSKVWENDWEITTIDSESRLVTAIKKDGKNILTKRFTFEEAIDDIKILGDDESEEGLIS